MGLKGEQLLLKDTDLENNLLKGQRTAQENKCTWLPHARSGAIAATLLVGAFIVYKVFADGDSGGDFEVGYIGSTDISDEMYERMIREWNQQQLAEGKVFSTENLVVLSKEDGGSNTSDGGNIISLEEPETQAQLILLIKTSTFERAMETVSVHSNWLKPNMDIASALMEVADGDPEKRAQVFEFMREHDISPTLRHLNVDQATGTSTVELSVIEGESGEAATQSEYDLMMKELYALVESAERKEEIISMLRTIHSTEHVNLNKDFLLMALRKEYMDFETGIELVRIADEGKIVLDTEFFNRLAHLAGNLNQAQKVLIEMNARDIDETAFTLQNLMLNPWDPPTGSFTESLGEKSNGWSYTDRRLLIETFHMDKLPMNVTAFNVLLDSAGIYKYEALDLMSICRIIPNELTLHIALQNEKTDDIPSLIDLIIDMRPEGIEPLESFAINFQLINNPKPEDITNLMKHIINRGIIISESTIEAIDSIAEHQPNRYIEVIRLIAPYR